MSWLMLALMGVIGGLAIAGLSVVIANIWYEILEKDWDKDD